MEKKDKIYIKTPGCGSCLRCFRDWDDGVLGQPEQIFIWCDSCIDSIQVAYSSNQSVTLAEKHGGTGGSNFYVVNLAGKSLRCIRGSVGDSGFAYDNALNSLCFETTCGSRYGPFGKPLGKPFLIDLSGCRVGGFHGRSCDNYLRAIGVYVETKASTHTGCDEKPVVTKCEARKSCNVYIQP